MSAVVDIRKTVDGVKENTEQILEAIGVFSNKVDGRLNKLEHEMKALNSSVKNYLELSDKRYLELRQTNRLMFKYLKMVAQKAGVSLDLSELEEMVR